MIARVGHLPAAVVFNKGNYLYIFLAQMYCFLSLRCSKVEDYLPAASANTYMAVFPICYRLDQAATHLHKWNFQ